MLSFQKDAFDKTGLGYDFSSPNIASSNIASSSTIVFVSPTDKVNSKNDEAKIEIASENLDKGKSIPRAPPMVEKKETRNPSNKNDKKKRSQQKKPHFCHRYGALGHIHPNCYKWLATQQSNSVFSSETGINFHPFLLLLEIFSMPSCSFRTWTDSILPPHLWIKGSCKGKVLPRCERKKAQSDLFTFSLFLPPPFWLCIACLFCFLVLSQSSFMLCVFSFMFLFGCFLVFVYFTFHKNKKNNKKLKNHKIQKQCVYVYIGTCVPWIAIETKFSKLCISCSLDEYLNAQPSKWVLWLVFVMSTIK